MVANLQSKICVIPSNSSLTKGQKHLKKSLKYTVLRYKFNCTCSKTHQLATHVIVQLAEMM